MKFLTIVKFIGFNRNNTEYFLSEEPLMRHGIQQKIEDICNTAILMESTHYEIKKLNNISYQEQEISPFLSEQVYQYWLVNGSKGDKENGVLPIAEKFPLLTEKQIEMIIHEGIKKAKTK